jgi:hypothetical protein
MAMHFDGIVIVQCAGTKTTGAGTMKTQTGRPIRFVAHPDGAEEPDGTYARPDAPSDISGRTWRGLVVEYNLSHEGRPNNPLGLLPAYMLYRPPTHPDLYREAVRVLGAQQVYILSAGWGLVRATYLLPCYDITFSHQADRYKRRGARDVYRDFAHLDEVGRKRVVFFGGISYHDALVDLTKLVRAADKALFFNSAQEPNLPGWRTKRYTSLVKRNWHYPCLAEFLRGDLEI